MAGDVSSLLVEALHAGADPRGDLGAVLVEALHAGATPRGDVGAVLVEVFFAERVEPDVLADADPRVLYTSGGPLVATGRFRASDRYAAELRPGGISLGSGLVSTEAGTRLDLELAADAAAPGVYRLYVVGEDLEDVAGSVVVLVRDADAIPVTDQARTTAALLAQVRRWLPPEYCGADPLLAGFAAALARHEQAVDDLREAATVGLGSDRWLTLAARGQGILRSSGEPDASLRRRIRTTEDQVTRPAIVEAVDEILAPDACSMLEWWEHSYLDVEIEGAGGLWLGSERLSGGPSSFLLLVPPRGWISFGAFLDDLFLDDSDAILGDLEATVYATLLNLVQRARAAGVFWRLCLES